MSFSDSLSGSPSGYVFPSVYFACQGLPGSSIVLSMHAILLHPGEPCGCSFSFLHRRCWLRHLRKVGHSHLSIEAVSGSLALRLTSLPPKASPIRITPHCARLATCVTSISHDELLSVHENNQSCPGAPQRHCTYLSIRISQFSLFGVISLMLNLFSGH